MRISSPARAGAALLWLTFGAQALEAQGTTWALTNARIETVSRGVIERGTVVIRGGLIAAVGADLAAPADARVLDLSGRTVYPGLIDLTSTLGLTAPQAAVGAGPGEAAQEPSRSRSQLVGLEPQRVVLEELRPPAAEVRAAREAGITAVLAAPSRGAFRGQSVLIPMRDSLDVVHAIRSPVALHMGYQGTGGGFGAGGGAGGAGARYPATLLGVIAYQRQALYDARRHAQLLDRYRQNPRGMERPPADERLNALVPVVRGELPVFFAAANENEIRRALRLAAEFGLNLTIVGGTEGFLAVDALRRARVPVVVSVDFPQPRNVTGWAYRHAQRHAVDDSAQADSAARLMVEGNAGLLNRAGVTLALASGGSLRPSEFLANVRKAIAAGLPRDTALAALTLRAAAIAGVGEQLGSVEPGKIANLVVAEGDLLGDSARVRMVFVDGIRYDPDPPAPSSRAREGIRTSATDSVPPFGGISLSATRRTP
jgi:imidazolonepropionase-like amidohydrolase